MPNILVTVGSNFGKEEYRIQFRNSKCTLSLACGNHPMSYPFKGAELNRTDIANLMIFLLESLGDDSDKQKSNLERSA